MSILDILDFELGLDYGRWLARYMKGNARRLIMSRCVGFFCIEDEVT